MHIPQLLGVQVSRFHPFFVFFLGGGWRGLGNFLPVLHVHVVSLPQKMMRSPGPESKLIGRMGSGNMRFFERSQPTGIRRTIVYVPTWKP